MSKTYEQKIDYNMVGSLLEARDFVAGVCKCSKEKLMYGEYSGLEENGYEDDEENCFLFEYNKYIVSLGYKKIRKTTLINRFMGYTRNLHFDEAKIYVSFLFNYLKANCKIEKEQNLSMLKPHLKKILDMHKNKTYNNNHFDDGDYYLNKLYGIKDSNANENSQEKKQTGNDFFIIKDREITEDDMTKAVEIDKKCYCNYIKDSEQFSPELCSSWNKKNGYRVYIMLKDSDNNILGYINAVPITGKAYSKIRSGKSPDSEIDPNCIIKYTLPGEYCMYFASIAIDEKLQGDRNLFIPLFNAFLDKLINLVKEEDIVISRVIADAVTENGKEICERLGMNKIKETEHDKSIIYELELYPPNFKITSSKFKELYNLYKKRFEQLNKEG